MSRRPFLVHRMASGRWHLIMRHPAKTCGLFDTQAEAIDHAYRNWPWWP